METIGKKRGGGRQSKVVRGKVSFTVAHVTADSMDDSNDNSHLLDVSALAISPVPDELDSSTSGNNVGECRRSSRKKIIKFDVRDLLNKNRKPHKIQIEARIDSNAPATKKQFSGQTPVTTTIVSDSVSSVNKQKNYLEKSAIFEKYSVNNTPIKPPPTPTLLLKTDNSEMDLATSASNLLRAKRSSSLIVAKMESNSRITTARKGCIIASNLTKDEVLTSNVKGRRATRLNIGSKQDNLPSDKCEESVETPIVKRRGRTPKNKSINQNRSNIEKKDLEQENTSETLINEKFLEIKSLESFSLNSMVQQEEDETTSYQEKIEDKTLLLDLEHEEELSQNLTHPEGKKIQTLQTQVISSRENNDIKNLKSEIKQSLEVSKNAEPKSDVNNGGLDESLNQEIGVSFNKDTDNVTSSIEDTSVIEDRKPAEIIKKEPTQSLKSSFEDQDSLTKKENLTFDSNTSKEMLLVNPSDSSIENFSENRNIGKQLQGKPLIDSKPIGALFYFSTDAEQNIVSPESNVQKYKLTSTYDSDVALNKEVVEEENVTSYLEKSLYSSPELTSKPEGLQVSKSIQKSEDPGIVLEKIADRSVQEEISEMSLGKNEELSTVTVLEERFSPKPVLSLPPKKKLSRFLQSKSCAESIKEVKNESAEIIKEKSSSPVPPKSSFSRLDTQSPLLSKKTTRRSDRRGQIGVKAKTLEEMFAEIAAESSREVLQSPQTIIDEETSSNSSSTKSESSQKMESKERVKGKNKNLLQDEALSTEQLREIIGTSKRFNSGKQKLKEDKIEESIESVGQVEVKEHKIEISLDNTINPNLKKEKIQIISEPTEISDYKEDNIENSHCIEEKPKGDEDKKAVNINKLEVEEAKIEISTAKSKLKLDNLETNSENINVQLLNKVSPNGSNKLESDKDKSKIIPNFSDTSSLQEDQLDDDSYNFDNRKYKENALETELESNKKKEKEKKLEVNFGSTDELKVKEEKLDTKISGTKGDNSKEIKKEQKESDNKDMDPSEFIKSNASESVDTSIDTKDFVKKDSTFIVEKTLIEDNLPKNDFKATEIIAKTTETVTKTPSKAICAKKSKPTKTPEEAVDKKDFKGRTKSSSKTKDVKANKEVSLKFDGEKVKKEETKNIKDLKHVDSSAIPNENKSHGLKKRREKLKHSDDKIADEPKKLFEINDKVLKANSGKSGDKEKETLKEDSSKFHQNKDTFLEENKSKKTKKTKCILAEKEIFDTIETKKSIQLDEKKVERSNKLISKTKGKAETDDKNLEGSSTIKDDKVSLDKQSKEKNSNKKASKKINSNKIENDFEISLNNVDDFSVSGTSKKSKAIKVNSIENDQQGTSKEENTNTPKNGKSSSSLKSELTLKKSSLASKTASNKRKKHDECLELTLSGLDVKSKKKRQRKLKDDFEATVKETEEKKSIPCVLSKALDNKNQEMNVNCLASNSEKIVDTQEVKPSKRTPGKNDSPDPLDDIEKFIADGVSLLKKDFLVGEEEEGNNGTSKKPQDVNEPKSINPAPSATSVETIEENLIVDGSTITFALNELNQKAFYTDSAYAEAHELMDPMMSTYLTPANTPTDSPIHTPVSSPCPQSPALPETPQSFDEDESPVVRRSHRLKQNFKGPKEGRGLVREKERVLMKEDGEMKISYSVDDHLTDLAEVEAINAKFLKEMEERLSNFQVIRENEYHCERIISKEAKRMLCECFLTPEEEDRGELGCGDDCLNRLLMIECGNHCKVKERCTNKRFQKQFYAPCRVFRTEKKGFGIMADVEILPGEFIMEYVGEVISGDELTERQLAYSKDKNRHYYFMALRGETTIDATIKGNISRFINHSCDPNAETQKWTVNGELRIGFFSLRSIKPGEEITFNYQYERYGREAQRCYCESANCAGWIGEEPNSDEDEQVEASGSETDEDVEEGEDEEVEDKVARGLSECLLNADDDSSEDDAFDRAEAQKKLELAAAEASLTEALTPEEQQKFKDENAALEKTGFGKDAKAKLRLLFNKLKERAEEKKKMKKEKKIQKRRKRKEPKSEVRSGPCEDPEVEDELNFLIKCGLKNQSDTLRLSRLMVRAKLLQTRLDILKVLTIGELACRRLFLDYNGLPLLHSWMSEYAEDFRIRSAVLEVLASLPIANKTILKDTKVYQTVLTWSDGVSSEEITETSPSEDSASTESPKEGITEAPVTSEEATAASINNDTTDNEELEPIKKLALELINNWNNLPEIFRIPKKERIEQMKEHEREADLQFEAAGEDDLRSSYRDRYGRDRYGIGRTITTIYENRKKSFLSDESLKHLSKEERREMFAAKVAKDEEEKKANEKRREFETKCRFFGLNVETTNPDDMPFYVNHDTGQWFSIKEREIVTPPAYAHVGVPTKPKSTNPDDYDLPELCSKLPVHWKYAITSEGYIYYYHIEHRIPQWEPPTPDQLIEVHSDSDSEINHEDDELLLSLNDDQLKEYIKKKADARIEKRIQRLFESRPISPRREEDRIYNQIEMRKYKENKEKIKKRKEKIRYRRAMLSKKGEKLPSVPAVEKSEDDGNEIIPIPDYLLSSDDEADVLEPTEAELPESTDNVITGRRSSLLDKIVEGDKIVDELDAITLNKTLKRSLPPHGEIPKDKSTDSPCSSISINSNEHSSQMDQVISYDSSESKRRKMEKKEKLKKSRESSETKWRRNKEKFREDISGIIPHFLKPYYNETCTKGRIQNDQDFKHLCRKLIHFVTIKEQKYCESIGQKLVVTESVKNKTREFIRKYMVKYGEVYQRSANEPEYKTSSLEK